MTHPRPTGSILPVVAWMMGALTAFVFAALAIRTLTRHLSVFEIGVVRTAIGLAVLLTVLAVAPSLRAQVVRAKGLSHLPRNLVHALGGVAWTKAIAILPFATVFSIEFTAPAWVALLAFPMLGERVPRRAALGIGLCILGVLVIMRPGAETFDAGCFLALGAAFCFALSILLMRRLALTQSVFAILFWMMIWQLAFYGAAACLAPDGRWIAASWPVEALVAVPVLGLAGLASQLCLSKALRIGEATTVVPLDFLRVPIIAVIGWAAFGEPLSMWVFSGAAIIMAGITYGLLPSQAQAASAAVPPVPVLPAVLPQPYAAADEHGGGDAKAILNA